MGFEAYLAGRGRIVVAADIVAGGEKLEGTMKIYISGKITGLDYETAFNAFEDADHQITLSGHEPVNPMAENGLDGDGKEYPWAEYMRRDIPLLLQCDGIYLLSNWADSKGARLERHIAEELGMEIIEAGG